MPNPNMTQLEYLQMCGTPEQVEEYKAKIEKWDKWIKENIPVYVPNRFIGAVQNFQLQIAEEENINPNE